MTKKLKLTLLTGFLGAGKTSLISRLMKKYPQKQFGIIENEFAQTDIDSTLLDGPDQAWIEQTNGCLCCRVEGDLWPVLHKLIQQAPRPLDHLILETTGLADPTPLVSALLSQGPHRELVQLDSVITLIDTQHFERQKVLNQEKMPEEMMGQILQATLFGMTKAESLSKQERESLKQELQAFNPDASVVNLSFDSHLPEDLLELEHFNLKKDKFTIPKLTRPVQTMVFLSHQSNSTHQHLKVVSKVIEKQGWLDPKVFELFLNITMAKGGGSLLRAKGLLAFKDQPQKVVFQGVYDQFEFDLAGPWDQELPLCQIVLIGSSDMIEMWDRGLENCLKSMTL